MDNHHVDLVLKKKKKKKKKKRKMAELAQQKPAYLQFGIHRVSMDTLKQNLSC
jgi:hypothetical protein